MNKTHIRRLLKRAVHHSMTKRAQDQPPQFTSALPIIGGSTLGAGFGALLPALLSEDPEKAQRWLVIGALLGALLGGSGGYGLTRLFSRKPQQQQDVLPSFLEEPKPGEQQTQQVAPPPPPPTAATAPPAPAAATSPAAPPTPEQAAEAEQAQQPQEGAEAPATRRARRPRRARRAPSIAQEAQVVGMRPLQQEKLRLWQEQINELVRNLYQAYPDRNAVMQAGGLNTGLMPAQPELPLQFAPYQLKYDQGRPYNLSPQPVQTTYEEFDPSKESDFDRMKRYLMYRYEPEPIPVDENPFLNATQ